MDRFSKTALFSGLAAGLLLMGCTQVFRTTVTAPASGPAPAVQATTPAADPGPSDLSICARAKTPLVPDTEIDVRDFAARLHGTWELRTRTIQGLTIDTN